MNQMRVGKSNIGPDEKNDRVVNSRGWTRYRNVIEGNAEQRKSCMLNWATGLGKRPRGTRSRKGDQGDHGVQCPPGYRKGGADDYLRPTSRRKSPGREAPLCTYLDFFTCLPLFRSLKQGTFLSSRKIYFP